MRGTIKKNYRQGKQEAPQQNKNGYSCSRTTNQVRPTPLLTTSRGTHTFPGLQSIIDKWILHQEMTAPSCHCELVKVEQVPSEARLRQHSPSKGKCACGYWLSNQTHCPVGQIPKGKTNLWFFQSPRCGLAVLIHGNQKDPCPSKLYKVGFGIIN